MNPRYAVPIFLGAFLLFQVQPIIARCILPVVRRFAVGLDDLHVVLRSPPVGRLRIQPSSDRPHAPPGAGRDPLAAHRGVAGGIGGHVLCLGDADSASGELEAGDPSQPVLRIIGLLAVAVGLPYLVLATTSPLLQAWFGHGHPRVSPYRLYTVSNVGSVLALLSYPFVVEPLLALRAQSWVWGAGYILFSLGTLYCVLDSWRMRSKAAETPVGGSAEAVEPPPGWRRKLLWVGLPALACVLFLAMTNSLCSEVAVIPFLWILPLTIYLLSFIVCFYSEKGYRRRFYTLAMIVAVAATLMIIPRTLSMNARAQIGLYAVTLFICCMVCHGELVALKPPRRYLTAFYLGVAAGGALGGILVGIVAPVVFNRYWELELGLAVSWALGLGVLWVHRRQWPGWVPQLVTGASVAVAACILIIYYRPDSRERSRPVDVSRNFYGTLLVEEQLENKPEYHRRVEVSGLTIHGVQYISEAKRRLPTSYYGAKSGVGLALLHHPRGSDSAEGRGGLRVGITGLGVGTLASYGHSGDTFRFYEINSDVVRIARDSGLIHLPADSQANIEVVPGDARMSLERELRVGSQQFDVLVLDAFSGDAIPAHLLTREAFTIYLQHLRPNGVVAINVSNRVLDLKPLIWSLAESMHLVAIMVPALGDNIMIAPSEWMLMSRDRSLLDQPEIANAGTFLHEPVSISAWTDDYHPLLALLK